MEVKWNMWKKLKGNRMLTVLILISVIILILGICLNKEKDTYISDGYVSLSAFIMLIGTAVMQNKDLKIQRKELQNSREALDKQAEEMEKHSKEFVKTNKFNNEQLNMSKFFDLLKMKEDLYLEVVNHKEANELNDFIKGFMDDLRLRFNNKIFEDIEMLGYMQSIQTEDIPILIEIHNLEDDKFIETEDLTLNDKHNFDELFDRIFEKCLHDVSLVHPVPERLLKLYTLNKLIKDMYGENINVFNILSKINKSFSQSLNKAFGIRDKTKLIDIYSKLKTKEEIILDKIVNSSLMINDLYE